MFTQQALILTALISLLIGGLIGYILAAGVSPRGGNSRRALENRLKSTEQQMEDYQTEVAKHFERTADLVNNLTESYKDVHVHLAKGAADLTDSPVGQQFLANSAKAWLPPEQPEELVDENANIEPPKDWAPEKGTLSEEFGLDKKNRPEEPQAEQPKNP